MLADKVCWCECQ